LKKLVKDQGWDVRQIQIIPDDFQTIKDLLTSWAEHGNLDLILTTGGTGFSARDITPEATSAVIDRAAPGLAEAMRIASLQITPHGMLSRAVAGIKNHTLIVNLPGSPKAATENFCVIVPVLPHAVQLMQDHPDSEAGH
jgi:molybdenum cofactor synthesis domain-containing protein